MKWMALAAALLLLAACASDAGDNQAAPTQPEQVAAAADGDEDAGGDDQAAAAQPEQVAVAAGGDDGGGEEERPGGPGQVQIAVDGLTGGNTQILLTMIHRGNPGAPVGVSCASIDDDVWSFTGPVYPIEGDHPCALGTTPIMFEPGVYKAFFGVFTGGQQTADQCVEVEFEVAGDTTVTAPALAAPCELYD